MNNYSDVQISYTCWAYPPENIHMDRIYRINKDKKGFYFTDGNYSEYSEVDYIKMLFTPRDCPWDEVSFDITIEK